VEVLEAAAQVAVVAIKEKEKMIVAAVAIKEKEEMIVEAATEIEAEEEMIAPVTLELAEAEVAMVILDQVEAEAAKAQVILVMLVISLNLAANVVENLSQIQVVQVVEEEERINFF